MPPRAGRRGESRGASDTYERLRHARGALRCRSRHVASAISAPAQPAKIFAIFRPRPIRQELMIHTGSRHTAKYSPAAFEMLSLSPATSGRSLGQKTWASSRGAACDNNSRRSEHFFLLPLGPPLPHFHNTEIFIARLLTGLFAAPRRRARHDSQASRYGLFSSLAPAFSARRHSPAYWARSLIGRRRIWPQC